MAQISHTPYDDVAHWPIEKVLLTSMRHTRNEQLRAAAIERAQERNSNRHG